MRCTGQQRVRAWTNRHGAQERLDCALAHARDVLDAGDRLLAAAAQWIAEDKGR